MPHNIKYCFELLSAIVIFNRGGCANLIILMSELMKILRAFYHYSVLIYVIYIVLYNDKRDFLMGFFVSFNVIYGIKMISFEYESVYLNDQRNWPTSVFIKLYIKSSNLWFVSVPQWNE